MSGAEEREWGNLFCDFCKIGSGSKVGYTRLGQDRSLVWSKNDFREIAGEEYRGREMRIGMEKGNSLLFRSFACLSLSLGEVYIYSGLISCGIIGRLIDGNEMK